MAGAAETARLVAELTLRDKMSKGIDSAIGKVDKLGKKTGIAAQGIQTAGRNIQRGLLLGAGAAVAGIGVSVKAAGDFEAELNTINTVAQLTGTAFDGALGDIGDSIRKLARDTGTSTGDLTQAYYDLVSAGIDAADAQNVLDDANTLAIGGLSTTAEAVDLLTTAINSYGGDASRSAKITNMFAEAIGAGKVTASEMAASFATVGPIAADFGIGIDEISAALGVMTAKGTPAAQAFTQMRSAIVALKKPNTTLAGFQKKLGIDFAKMAKKKGLAYAYDQLTTAAKKAGIPIEKLTGRVEGALFAAQVAGDNFAGYNEELEKVRASSEGAGVAQEQADKRMQGFNYSMDKLKANVKDAAITIGSELLPQLADLAGEFSTFISDHQGDIKTFAQNLSGAFRDAIDWAKKLDWAKIGDALKSAAGFAKGIVDAFLAMPADVQATILALGGLNKLSGGAVSGIVGELGKGLIKGVLGMTAGVVNVRGAVVNTGGVPGAAGAGAAGAGGAGASGAGAAGGLLAPGAGPLVVGAALPFAMFYGVPAIVRAVTGVQGTRPESGKLEGKLGSKPTAFTSGLERQLGAMLPGLRLIEDEQSTTNIGVTKLTDTQLLALGEQRDTRDAVALGALRQESMTRGMGMLGAAATSMSSFRVVDAIRSSKPTVNTNVVVTVTAANVQKSVSTQSTYGAYGGSAVGAHNGRNILD